MERKARFTLPVSAEVDMKILEEWHAEELYQLIERNRAHLRRWLPWVEYETSVEKSRNFVQRSLQRYMENDGFNLGIFYRGRMAGLIGFHSVNWPNKHVEIGYWLGAEFEGKGLVTSACRALLAFAFEKLMLNRVVILCATGNARSRAIPERLGFTQEGVLRDGEWLYDHFVDLAIYSMLAREWQSVSPGLL